MLRDEPRPTDAERALVRYQPLGPVLAIMPWNFPFWQVFRFAAPALMAGNVGLLKHASNVPGCALAIEDVLRRAGFDHAEFRTLLVGTDAVERIIGDARVRAVTLTGSEGAGRAVGGAAGRSIKKSVLELGGSDPFIVMPSADIARAADVGVQARIVNNGQSCIAAKRFIVHERVFDEFAARFVAGLEALVVGNPMEERTQIGPLATEQIRIELAAQVEQSVQRGARVLTGGRIPERAGWFYPPTALTDIPRGAPAFGEELFGPVAALFRVRDIEEAIALANATRFGLGSAAWTNDTAEQQRFTEELDAGLVFINAMVASDPRLPFGGVKASGYGRELDTVGIREFVNIKTVVQHGSGGGGRHQTE
jgi:succinate-semialdehyde dehydrogenase/glutarate-semialdehyde dehydrogenase